MEGRQRLGGEQVLDLARFVVGACPGGREAAPEMIAGLSGHGQAFEEAESSILSAPAWAGVRGAILFRGPASAAGLNDGFPALFVAWLEPHPHPHPGRGFPSQLALDLPAGRYAILTYDSEKRLAVGSETASGPPVICGPPFDGAALVVLVRPLAPPHERSRDQLHFVLQTRN